MFTFDFTEDIGEAKGDFYIFRAKGDSMFDAGIDEKNLLVIVRNCPALEGNIVVALDEDNQNMLKRYAGYDEDSGLLHPRI